MMKATSGLSKSSSVYELGVDRWPLSLPVQSGRENIMSFESRNPATGELLGTYPEHDKSEIEVRLQRAWDGWRGWSRTPLQERIAFLTRLAELLEERVETYSRLITAEMGKPLADSIFEIKKSAWAAR